jgi:hypothetical protein
MNKKEKKRMRQKAIRAEIARREADRAARSPFGREEMLELVSYVGGRIMSEGHHFDFSYTKEWLKRREIQEEAAIRFLNEEKISDDWSLCVSGDPYKLFGSTENRLAWMPLEREDLEDLLDWLDEQIEAKGCNHDLSLTAQWLNEKGFDVPSIQMALLAQGGGCDCEVVMNLEPETIYPSVLYH